MSFVTMLWILQSDSNLTTICRVILNSILIWTNYFSLIYFIYMYPWITSTKFIISFLSSKCTYFEFPHILLCECFLWLILYFPFLVSPFKDHFSYSNRMYLLCQRHIWEKFYSLFLVFPVSDENKEKNKIRQLCTIFLRSKEKIWKKWLVILGS